MEKKYELIIRVMLAEATDSQMNEAAWREEEINILGTLDDLATMLNNNGAAQTARQMATRLMQRERQGTWTD